MKMRRVLGPASAEDGTKPPRSTTTPAKKTARTWGGFMLSVDRPDDVKGADFYVPAVNMDAIKRDLGLHVRDRSVTGPLTWYKTTRKFRKMTQDQRARLLGINARTPSSAFTVACLMTHRRAWAEMLSRGLDYALVLEEDAHFDLERELSSAATPEARDRRDRDQRAYVERLVAEASAIDSSWHLVNLGRCWDFCETQRVCGRLSNNRKLVRSLTPGCTHAYVVSRAGATALLANSLPYIVPVDYLIQLLQRTEVLNGYSVTPPAFSQIRTNASHDRTRAVECDASERAKLRQYPPRDINDTDTNVLKLLETSWISTWLHDSLYPAPDVDDLGLGEGSTQDATLRGAAGGTPDAKTTTTTSRAATENNKNGPACRHLADFCVEVGGVDGSPEALAAERCPPAPSDTTRRFLERMDALNLQTFAVWGLRGREEKHTHQFIHDALNQSAYHAMRCAPARRRVCWVPSNVPGLCGDDPDHPSTDTLDRAYVFATPKHSVFTRDPLLAKLPARASNRYLFHELVPPKFRRLQALGRVAQWVVRGPDGSSPVFDAEQYALRLFTDCDALRCLVGDVYVAPWGTRYPPRPRADAKTYTGTGGASGALSYVPVDGPLGLPADAVRGDAVNLVATIWHLNAREFCQFVKGCNDAGVPVVRHGVQPTPPNVCDGQVKFEDRVGIVTEEAKLRLVAESKIAPCLQGANHLDGKNSYISDRTFDFVALELPVVTNNRFAAEVMNLSYAEPQDMCGVARDVVNADSKFAKKHSYIERLNDVLGHFLATAVSLEADATDLASSRRRREGAVTLVALEDDDQRSS